VISWTTAASQVASTKIPSFRAAASATNSGGEACERGVLPASQTRAVRLPTWIVQAGGGPVR
jgi:hypothetical protein